MRAPHRVCVAPRERCGRLDRRNLELLQCNLLPAFPRLASPLYAGPRARSRADLSESEKSPGVSDRAERADVLVAAPSRLSAARARLSTRPAVCAGGGAACDCAVDVGTNGDLFGRGGGNRLRL